MKKTVLHLRLTVEIDEGESTYRLYEPDKGKPGYLAKLLKWQQIGSGFFRQANHLTDALADIVRLHVASAIRCREIAKEKHKIRYAHETATDNWQMLCDPLD